MGEYELPDNVSIGHLRDSAWLVAKAFEAGDNTVSVALTPGDQTVYHVLLARNVTRLHSSPSPQAFTRPDEWIVSLLNRGRAYPWTPEQGRFTHWTYVLGHWTEEEHTAKVLAAFLNILRDTLAGVPESS